MLEHDLARLRFLNTRALKGEYLKPEDLAFVLDKKQEMKAIMDGIEEILVTQMIIEEML